MSVDRKEKRVKLTLKNISKSFYARKEIFEAVSNISIDVYENEFLVILGPGQCGKSVLLNMISGLEEPTAGEVMFPSNDEKKSGFCIPEDSGISLEDGHAECGILPGAERSQ